jgi:hypothetical protein
MFCHEFEKIAGDLVAERLMEAGKRERALDHASECSACALRLSAERTLEAGLQTLRASAEEGDAPPHLKMALRAAFDRHVKAASVAPVAPINPVAPVVPVASGASVLSFAPARSRNSALRWLAVAAVILIAVAIALWSRATLSNSKEYVSGVGNQAPREQPMQPVIEHDNQNRKIKDSVARQIPTQRGARRRAATSGGMTNTNETVTDYIPLTYLADATAMESGMVLRVELPPSALVRMGLPAPVERTDSRVKADLIVGDDGVPRAVRFVAQDSVRR